MTDERAEQDAVARHAAQRSRHPNEGSVAPGAREILKPKRAPARAPAAQTPEILKPKRAPARAPAAPAPEILKPKRAPTRTPAAQAPWEATGPAVLRGNLEHDTANLKGLMPEVTTAPPTRQVPNQDILVSPGDGKAPDPVIPPQLGRPTRRTKRRMANADPERAVTVVPPVPDNHREIESTIIIPDRAWVRVLLNEVDQNYLYQVIEPALSDDEKSALEFLRDTLIRTLDGRKAAEAKKDWSEVLLLAAQEAIDDHRIRIDDVAQERLEYYLVRDFLGYGPIDVLMRDGMIEDISCDGPGIPIYLFHRKYEALRTSVKFPEELELDGFVIRLAQRSGKHISVADPLLDATLPDGSRLQAALSREVTTRGSTFTIRKFRADPLTPPDLIRYGTMSTQMAAYFWFVMEMGASFIMAGGTASGKTTTLNAISQFIPPEKKIVSIEDTREINLLHDNWIAGITRGGFGAEGPSGKRAGAVDMYKLLEAALRQRPEYLLVGEVRGPEALTLFQAMATGHACYSTMHADAVPSAVYRLENAPINVPRMMLQTLDLFVIQGQVRLKDRMARRVKEVTELIGFDPETKELLTNTVFEWDVVGDSQRYLGKSYILEQVMEARNLTEDQLLQEWSQRVEVLDWMIKHDVRHYGEVAKIVSSYYRDPRGLLARLRSA